MAIHQRLKPRSTYQRISNFVKTRPIQTSFVAIVIIILIIYLFTRTNNSIKQEIKLDLIPEKITLNEPILPFQEITENITNPISNTRYRYF